MVNLIVGVIAMVLGLWGLSRNWYMFMDLVGALVPLILIGAGIVIFLAGIRAVRSK
ncbi:MAG: hypothetical protein HQL11_04715 [Candidatus Omnitrophica bacterium]|nr:hypothetical protein [Candidatus Omnitrophota bacterium]